MFSPCRNLCILNILSSSHRARATQWWQLWPVDAHARRRWLIIQINYVTYLHTTISDINLFNVFTLLFVSRTISDAIAEKFAMNCAQRRRLPRHSHGARRCVVRCWRREKMEEDKMKWMFKWHKSAVLAHANFVVWSWREQLWFGNNGELTNSHRGLTDRSCRGKKTRIYFGFVWE